MFRLFRREHPLDSHAVALRAGLNFDDEDLRANHEGLLSERQRQRFMRRQRMQCVVVPVTIICIWGLVFAFFSQEPPLHRLDFPFLLPLIPTVILLAWLMFDWLRLKGDLASGSVAVVEGIARRGVLRPMGSASVGLISHPRRYVSFGDTRAFWVGLGIYMAFSDEAIYRVYYASRFRRILSAEYVGDDI